MGALDGFFSAQRSALDSQDRFVETRARNMAGRRLAKRDYAGAATELYDAGQLEAGSAVQGFERSQEVNQQRDQDRQRGIDAEKVKERASLLMQVSQGLKEVPAGQRKAQLDRISPIFQKVGIDTAMFGQLSEQDLTDDALDAFAGSVAQEVEFIKSSDGSYTAASKSTGLPQFQYRAPRPDEFKEVDPAKDLVRIPGNPGAASAPAMGGASGGFEAAIGPLLKREGGYVGRDGRSGAPANFGINQKHNPDIDVKNLTADQAKQLYKTRYWDAINADQLPPDAQAAVFDAAVNQGPETAVKMWQESGQDVNRFNELRLQRYRQTPGYAESGRSWERRVAETGGPEVVRRGQPKPAESWVDLPGGGQRNTVTGKTEGVPKTSGRLPAAAINLQNTALEAIQGGSAVNTRLASIVGQLDKGALNLGPVSNIGNSALNLIGRSTPGSANYASFRSDLEKLRNDSLRLNKGVQTEGDAVRAWNELMSNLNDERVVKQRLMEIQGYNRQALAFQEDVVAQLREDAGLPPIDVTKFRAKPSPRGSEATAPAPRRQAAPAPATGAPRVGEVRKGYKFNGGDPSKPQSWTKVQ